MQSSMLPILMTDPMKQESLQEEAMLPLPLMAGMRLTSAIFFWEVRTSALPSKRQSLAMVLHLAQI
jgi:hypothetical protein